MNKIEIYGNIGKIEINATTAGKPYALLSLAESARWTDKNTGEIREVTTWHKLSTFSDRLVALIEANAKVGAFVKITGSLKSHSYTSDGETKTSTEIVIRQIQPIARKLNATDEAAEQEAA